MRTANPLYYAFMEAMESWQMVERRLVRKENFVRVRSQHGKKSNGTLIKAKVSDLYPMYDELRDELARFNKTRQRVGTKFDRERYKIFLASHGLLSPEATYFQMEFWSSYELEEHPSDRLPSVGSILVQSKMKRGYNEYVALGMQGPDTLAAYPTGHWRLYGAVKDPSREKLEASDIVNLGNINKSAASSHRKYIFKPSLAPLSPNGWKMTKITLCFYQSVYASTKKSNGKELTSLAPTMSLWAPDGGFRIMEGDELERLMNPRVSQTKRIAVSGRNDTDRW